MPRSSRELDRRVFEALQKPDALGCALYYQFSELAGSGYDSDNRTHFHVKGRRRGEGVGCRAMIECY